MLDTDICSYVIRVRNPRLLGTLQAKAHSGAEISISAISYAELRLGAERTRRPNRYRLAIRLFCDRLNRIMAWDATAAEEFAVLQAELLKIGKPIGRNDAMIAAHALSIGCVLVTKNRKHFARVPGLKIENWIA
ncbi:MAG: type II toxin-antitoxin system VapC family toxin [Acidobacteriota bacterium]|nr:type II toxin-antitoxin system VapC family toxin [Acidobacteriota bacterium]